MGISRIEESFVGVPGGSVFVRTWTPDKVSTSSPMFLLHDSLGSVELWRDFPHELAHRLSRPIIAYDRLGFGKSTPRSGLPSASFVSEEADVFFPAVRTALGITRFSLFGHSVGGAMALMIAAAQTTDCDFVVTESAQAFVEQRTLAGILAGKEQFSCPEQFSRLIRWHGDRAKWVLDAWTEVWLSPAFASWNLDPHLGKVRCPVLAIHGDLDEYGSLAFPTRIVQGVQGPSRLAILERCGHVPHREHQDQVLDLVSCFMAKPYATSASVT
ncbi:MAG TPA: alpha/beta hydrolase [Geobacteraceae bacterium]|nr:alpha/beta hydrolase [Geobacteraceae bacterium]